MDWCALLGRILLAALFLPAGVEKLLDLQGTIGAVAGAGMPLANIVGPIGAAIEALAPLLLAIGLFTRFSAAALIVFTAVASYYFHHFWNMTGEDRMTNEINFWKNMAVIGGLFYVLGYGAGRIALDRWRTRRT
ncbi:MAG TPA: DoxX family protein [Rhizomicrobium sp.]|nr:DoxX family protein [Rhizomicrobium sp.]